MSNAVQIQINPREFYNKYASQDYVLCDIVFTFLDEETHIFFSECSNTHLSKIISTIDDYFNGKIKNDTELYFDIPWIIGGFIVYHFSFKISVTEKKWTFRYKENQNNTDFDFVYQMSEDDVRSMRTQLENEYKKMDWESLGKSYLYTFELPPKDFEWCYSAKAFADALNVLCRGKQITSIYVSATNYEGPLTVKKNFVNYYTGSEIIIQLDGGIILDLLIFASGLFKWRVFTSSETAVIGPRHDFIQNGDREFCKIHDVYHAFKLEYCNSNIQRVVVQKTDWWPWSATSFDKSKLGDPIELPKEVFFELKNGNTLSFAGWDDDFVIRIKETKE